MKPDFFRFGVNFRACSLQNEVSDPLIFYVFDIAKSSSYTGKSLRKKSMLENFRANVLKKDVLLTCIFLQVSGTCQPAY